MKKNFVLSLALCSALTALPVGQAFAQAFGGIKQLEMDYKDQQMGTRNWQDWDVTVGVGAEYEPVSPGIDEYEIDPLPYVDIEYKKQFFLKSNLGLGMYLLRSQEDPEYGMGIALGYNEGRNESDAKTQLEGLGDIDAAPEAIVFFEGEVGPIEMELELAQGLGGHEGFRGELYAGVDGMVTDRLYLGAGPFITYGDQQYIESYFGITPGQAARSVTYDQYDTDGGFESYGVEASARYQLTQSWSALGFVEYTSLMGDAKDSPIVDDEGFFSAGTAIAYTF